jgi:EAL and modified HD-GYP domain-containing signal transduction protein
MQDIFIGRQPVYNRNLGVYAYEMLFRDSAKNSTGNNFNEDAATSQVIINTFLDIGLDNLVGTSMVCINITERLLFESDVLPLPASRVILDIQPNININEDTMGALQRLKSAGFTLALEGFLDTPYFDELLKLIDIINLDIHEISKQETLDWLKKLKKFNVKVLAEKVETLDEYEEYMHLGFDYFQGYFLSRPRIFKGKTLETNKLQIMQLLSILHNSSSDISTIEEAITSDLTLSYKLLKLINSAFFNLPSNVESIKHAIVFLGRKKITSWASMLALTSMNDQPIALVKIAMVRAKTCELIAIKLGLEHEDQFFTTGMFSALDILMQRSLDSLITPLPLTEEVKQAILHYKGRLGIALKCSQLLETSAASRISIKGISKAELSALYLQADNWAQEITRGIS